MVRHILVLYLLIGCGLAGYPQPYEFLKQDIVLPAAINKSLEAPHGYDRTVQWLSPTKILFVDRDSNTAYEVDICKGEVIEENGLGEYEIVEYVDRGKGVIGIRDYRIPVGVRSEIRLIQYKPSVSDKALFPLHSIHCSYLGGFKKAPAYQLSYVDDMGNTLEQGAVVDIRTTYASNLWSSFSSLLISDYCGKIDTFLLSESKGGLGNLYLARVKDFAFVDYRRIRDYGAFTSRSKFIDEKTIITSMAVDDLLHSKLLSVEDVTKDSYGDDIPERYFPVIVGLDGEIIYEDVSIVIVGGVGAFDYDPISGRFAAIVDSSGADGSGKVALEVYKLLKSDSD